MMTQIIPRFEFRTFAQNLDIVEDKMRSLSAVGKIRESSEIYIISTANNTYNVKIRYDMMDIKALIQEKEGLEQWSPFLKAAFPLEAQLIREEIFPVFDVTLPKVRRKSFTLDQFLSEIIKPHPDLVAVNVLKKRHAFTINDCIAEVAEVLIQNTAVKTACLESTEIDKIHRTKKLVSLDKYKNVNYIQGIKRTIGMVG